jgi:hypothetical protein
MRPLLTLLALACVTTFAQEQPRRPDHDRSGPWDNDVIVYRVDGAEPEKLATFERAGVPTAARMADGRLIAAFQNFPQDDDRHFDRVAVRFSEDEGRTWANPEPIVVEGMDEGLMRPFDPTLVPLLDGRIRIYFTSNRARDFRQSTPAIYSAIGTDGIHYTFEPGVRFAIEGRVVIDCAVALHEGTFHLIVPDNGAAEDFMSRRGAPPGEGNGYHAVSKDGLTFERLADVKLPSRGHWLGNMQSDGNHLTFFGSGPGSWPMTSTDGAQWEPAEQPAKFRGADPGAVKLKDGAWLVIATSPPRPGTPSAQRQQQR